MDKTVFLVHHLHTRGEDWEDLKLVGCYSEHEKAVSAVARLSSQPGFIEQPEGFSVDEYQLDVDHWTEGFVTEEH